MENVCLNCGKSYPNVIDGRCPRCRIGLANVEAHPGQYPIDYTTSSPLDDVPRIDERKSYDDSYYNDYDDEYEYCRQRRKASGRRSDRMYDKRSKKREIIRDERLSVVSGNNVRIRGTIQGKPSQIYEHRFGIQKFFDLCSYGQCMSNTCNHFTVTDDYGKTYEITIYGDIGGRGAHLDDGARVDITGKINNHDNIIASHVRCNGVSVDFYNAGDYSPLDRNDNYGRYPRRGLFDMFFQPRQRSSGAGLIIMILLIGVLCYYLIPAFRVFIGTWMTMTLITIIVCLSFPGLRSIIRSPTAYVIIGFIITICFYNIGGLGSIVAAVFNSVGGDVFVIIIMLVGIGYMFKSMR